MNPSNRNSGQGLVQRLVGNSYLPLFDTTIVVELMAPWVLPMIRRYVRQPSLQPWLVLMVCWGVCMLSLPTLTLIGNLLLFLSHQIGFQPLSEPLSMFWFGLVSTCQVWGLYYIIRLTLTKLFYGSFDKYPVWPTGSVWTQMDRYVFRPEIFSLCLVTLFWIMLGNQLTDHQVHQVYGHWGMVDYVLFWVPWLLGGLWPASSVFFHRKFLRV